MEKHTPRGAAAGVDSFNKDTKDEKIIDIQAVWESLMLKLHNSRGFWQKIYKIQRGIPSHEPKLHREQLAFDLEF